MTGAIVAVVAHPDDESLIAGGTLAMCAAAGARTGVVSLTRGELGPISDERLTPPEHLGRVRERELRAAGRELGAEFAMCLRLPDGWLPWVDRDSAAEKLRAVLFERDVRTVLTFGDDGVYWHPDHIAAAEIAALAVRRVDPRVDLYRAAWPYGLVPELIAAAAARGLPIGLWGLDPQSFGSTSRQALAIDVRPVVARKLAALRAHRTQIGTDHLFASLPHDLAERYLGFERWTGPANGALKELAHDG
jgi:LmbE family N-acetylglucosaminyl deacetylase